MDHKMTNQNRMGLSWKQCDNCGCTRHSGYWWLSGYKSKTKPPCLPGYPIKPGILEWKVKAKEDGIFRQTERNA